MIAETADLVEFSHTPKSLWCEKQKEKYPVSSSYAGRNNLLMRGELRREQTDWFEVTGRVLDNCYVTVMSSKASANLDVVWVTTPQLSIIGQVQWKKAQVSLCPIWSQNQGHILI